MTTKTSETAVECCAKCGAPKAANPRCDCGDNAGTRNRAEREVASDGWLRVENGWELDRCYWCGTTAPFHDCGRCVGCEHWPHKVGAVG